MAKKILKKNNLLRRRILIPGKTRCFCGGILDKDPRTLMLTYRENPKHTAHFICP